MKNNDSMQKYKNILNTNFVASSSSFSGDEHQSSFLCIANLSLATGTAMLYFPSELSPCKVVT